ncbi:LysM domain receptor-like kinase 3 [Linum grandiflorum]
MAVEAAAPSSRRTRRSSSSTGTTQSSSITPNRPPPQSQSPRERLTFTSSAAATAAAAAASSSSSFYSNPSSSASNNTASSSSLSSRTSLSSLRDSLSQNPHIYDISEIRRATNNFLAKTYSSSCWRCNLRGNTDAIVFQRKFRRKIETDRLKELLSVICRSNHVTVVRLLGASISGDYIYLVYEFVKGANLADCLRNARNPDFTVLSSWISRIRIAADLAHALDYVHNKTGLNMTLVHNHFTSSSVIVTEPSLNAKICHFGTAQLCGEVDDGAGGGKPNSQISTLPEEEEEGEEGRSSPRLTRSDSAGMQFQGVRGYMSPEFQSTGIATQKSDVYAFGVVILELLSGEEPRRYRFDKSRGEYVRTTLIETATAATSGGGGDGRLRKWMDRRLKDSFPVDVAERLVRIALECVHVEAVKRPDMGRVAGKISRLYIDSEKWNDSIRMPTDQISVSLAAR